MEINKTFTTFHPLSKVWIYQANRILNDKEVLQINQLLEGFVNQWTAHNKDLKAFGKVYYSAFILLMVDETQEHVSGCSIDASYRFLKQLESSFNITLFDRFSIAYKENGSLKIVPKIQFEQLLKEGKITDETIVFNNLVNTKEALESKWEIPLKESWHKQLLTN